MNRYKIHTLYTLIGLIGILFLSSCGGSTLQMAPQSRGNLNKLVIVADQDLWDGAVGDTIRYYLSAAYPVLPQPEPIFDIIHFTMKDINENIDRKQFRNLIFIADMLGSNSPVGDFIQENIGAENVQKMKDSDKKIGIKISENRWANGQSVLFFYGLGEDLLAKSIIERSPSISKLIKENDAKMLHTRTYISGRNVGINNKIKNSFGISMEIPSDYVQAMHDQEKDFMWLRKIGREQHSNILIHKVKYESTDQLKPEHIKSLRDSLGQWYIESGQIDGSFMRVNDKDLPLYFENKPLDGKFTIQMKGIWEMDDLADMMGGPFLSYMIHNAGANELIFLDAFVFAPGKQKRDLMQGMELILSKTLVDE